MYDLKNMPKIDLEELRTFVAVAQLGSFSGAAELLHKSTPAMSYRIKTLEDRMGVLLFERSTRSTRLTLAGERLLEKASLMFEWMCNVPDELKQIQEGVEPYFTLVINNILYDAKSAAALLMHLHQHFPRTEFRLKVAVFMGVWDAMQYGGAHLAIGAPGFHSISDDFCAEPLGEIRWTFVAAPSHPLAEQEKPYSLEALRHYPAVNIEDTSQHLQKRSAWRILGQQEFLVPDWDAKAFCYEAGLGIGFLPTAIAHQAIAENRLVDLTGASTYRAPFPLSLAWRAKEKGKITDYLRHSFVEHAPIISPFLRSISALNERTRDQD